MRKFNNLIPLAVLGGVASFLWVAGCDQSNQKMDREIREFAETGEEFRESFGAATTTEETSEILDRYSAELSSEIQDVVESATGVRKQAAEIIQTLTEQSRAANTAFQQAFAKVEDPRLMDFSRLKGEEEFTYQRNVLKDYVEASKVYYDQSSGNIDAAVAGLRAIEGDDEFVKGVITGMTSQFEKQKPVFKPLMDVHVQYGQSLTEMLDFLQQREGNWEVNAEGALAFASDGDVAAFNVINEKVMANEAELNRLSLEQQRIIAGQ